MNEASLHLVSSFVTLTYEGDCDPSLRYRDFQLFCKKARRELGPFRFFMAGEYGEENFRPHFHAAMFGVYFSDRYPWRKSPSGFQLYRSATLESLWPHGNAEIGDVTFESAAYIARYVCKKVTGDEAKAIQDDGTPGHYVDFDSVTGEWRQLEPEFARMSLRPGVGGTWFDRFSSDVFPLDRSVVRGAEQRPPRYYMRLLQRRYPLMAEAIRQERLRKADEISSAEGPSLASMDVVAKARLAQRGKKL